MNSRGVGQRVLIPRIESARTDGVGPARASVGADSDSVGAVLADLGGVVVLERRGLPVLGQLHIRVVATHRVARQDRLGIGTLDDEADTAIDDGVVGERG